MWEDPLCQGVLGKGRGVAQSFLSSRDCEVQALAAPLHLTRQMKEALWCCDQFSVGKVWASIKRAVEIHVCLYGCRFRGVGVVFLP